MDTGKGEHTLQNRLLNCDATTSLLAERAAARVLHRGGWQVHHGRYYSDPRTAKARESDVYARMVWVREVRAGRQFAELILFAEVKTIRDYHLVFAPSLMNQTSDRLCEWAGYEERDSLENWIVQAGAPRAKANAVAKWFTKAAYPGGGMRLAALAVDPPVAERLCTTFRETNLGNDRDIDSSVLWRGIQSVVGAVESERIRCRENRVHDLKVAVQAAEGHPEKPVEYIHGELMNQVNSLELYHAVVLVHSQLWLLTDTGLETVPSCRFVLGDAWPVPWVDVVHVSAFESWVLQLGSHYVRHMRRVNAKPLWRSNIALEPTARRSKRKRRGSARTR